MIVFKHILLKTDMAKVLGARPFHEFQVIGVVNNSAAVRILVIDAHGPYETIRFLIHCYVINSLPFICLCKVSQRTPAKHSQRPRDQIETIRFNKDIEAVLDKLRK